MAVFTVDELSAYPGVSALPASVAMVAQMVNEQVAEAMVSAGVAVADKPATVKRLALAVAARPLRNPENAQTRSIQIDDFKSTVVLGEGSVTRGDEGIGFTPDEMGELVAAITGQAPQRGSIKLSVPGYAGYSQVDCR